MEKQNNTVTINWSDNIYKKIYRRYYHLRNLKNTEEYSRKNQFKTEYLGEWLDNEGVVFDNFKNCVKNNKINTYEQLFVGIDWASGVEADETVISILNSKGEQLYIDGFNNINTTQTIDRLMSVINPHLHQIVSITPETNSIGKPFTDLLTERLPQTQRHKVQGFTTSNTSKGELVSDLQVAFPRRVTYLYLDEKSN